MDTAKRPRTGLELATQGPDQLLASVVDSLRQCDGDAVEPHWEQITATLGASLARSKGLPVRSDLDQALLQTLTSLEVTLRSSPSDWGEFKLMDVQVPSYFPQNVPSQACIQRLQRAVSEHSPPPNYRPPRAWTREEAKDVITYAHKLSYTTFAPAGFVLGTTPLHLHKPPAPQEAQLRSCQAHELERALARVCGEGL